MNSIHIQVPQNVIIKGTLLRDYPVQDLDQDILEVELPNGITIDVGWYPQYDPTGSFQIATYRDYWNNQIRPLINVRTPFDVAIVIADLAREYLSPAPIENVGYGTTNTWSFSVKPDRRCLA